MKITTDQLKEVNLHQYPTQQHLFGDWENIEFNQKTNELFWFDCIDGSTELYRKVKDFEDLKQALYDGFGSDWDDKE